MESETSSSSSVKSLFVPFTTFKAIHWIILAGFIVYGNMLFNGFVWDDFVYILDAKEIHSFNVSQLFGLNIFNNSGYYRPFPAVYFSMLYSLFNTQAFFYHFVQLCFHIVNSILLLYFFNKFFSKTISFFLVLLFLVHPIQVESVSFISASQSALFFMFGISALLISLRKTFHWQNWGLISLLLLFALLTKETGILFFLIVFLFQIVVYKNNLLLKSLFLIAPFLFYISLRFFIVKLFLEHNAASLIAMQPLSIRLINVPAILTYYGKTILFPVQLGIDQHWVIQKTDVSNFYIPLILLLFLICILFVFGFSIFRKHQKYSGLFIIFIIWLFSGMGMLLQIFPLDMTVADRWMYFPIVGFLGLIGIVFSILSKNINKHKSIYLVISVLIITIFSLRTIVRNTNWHDSITLYSHDITVHDNFDLENNLGAQLAKEGRFNESLPHLQKSVNMFAYDTNLYNLASNYLFLHDDEKAVFYYQKAIQAKGDSRNKANAFYLLISLLLKQNNFEYALVYAEEAHHTYPKEWKFVQQLAIIHNALQHHEKALDYAKKAVELHPTTETKNVYNSIKI